MPNSLSQFAYPEHFGMEHDQAHNEQDAMGNALQMWLMGVKERTLHPLNALAQVSQQAMDDPTGTALNWSNPMNAVGGGLAGIFAGKGAKTADIVMLDLAQKLKDAGVPDRQIHAQTGWTYGFPDGKPRFEIPDDAAHFSPKLKELGIDKIYHNDYIDALGTDPNTSLMMHDKALNAYPELNDVRVYADVHPFVRNETGSFGLTDTNRGRLQLQSKEWGDEAKSTTLHELQHAIQKEENFARGGSPDSMLPILDAQHAQSGMPPPAPIDAYSAYKRLAGEAEARLTQARMNMTAEQRLKSYPLDMMDVPVDQQIVRYGDNGPAMATVYHGSPHLFDKFDMSKIGTGEGAQAYGHGLYFAESQDVAKSYQDLAKRAGPQVDGAQLNRMDASFEESALANMYQNRLVAGLPPDQAAAQTAKWGASHPQIGKDMADSFVQKLAPPPDGNMYKVDIPDEAIPRMLDWDKPLSEQHPDVRAAFGNAADNIKSRMAALEAKSTPSVDEIREYGTLDSNLKLLQGNGDFRYLVKDKGSSIYNDFSRMAGHDQRKATDLLNSIGIKGIRYLDGGSRGTGQGTSNYVLFDDQLPKILERNGKPLK